jgi:hypothetical protein
MPGRPRSQRRRCASSRSGPQISGIVRMLAPPRRLPATRDSSAAPRSRSSIERRVHHASGRPRPKTRPHGPGACPESSLMPGQTRPPTGWAHCPATPSIEALLIRCRSSPWFASRVTACQVAIFQCARTVDLRIMATVTGRSRVHCAVLRSSDAATTSSELVQAVDRRA